MKKIGIFYGSTTGSTQEVAKLIAQKLGIESTNVIDVAKASAELVSSYELLFLGSSTWGVGDLQDDWEGFITQLKKVNLSGKEVAVFGTGDSSGYSDTFCDAVGILAETVVELGAKLVGQNVDKGNYSYSVSKLEKDGAFCGLAIDSDNESNKTNDRVAHWIEQIKRECSL